MGEPGARFPWIAAYDRWWKLTKRWGEKTGKNAGVQGWVIIQMTRAQSGRRKSRSLIGYYHEMRGRVKKEEHLSEKSHQLEKSLLREKDDGLRGSKEKFWEKKDFYSWKREKRPSSETKRGGKKERCGEIIECEKREKRIKVFNHCRLIWDRRHGKRRFWRRTRP